MKRTLKKFDDLVDALSTLPSIGKKSAIRMAYHMVCNDNLVAIKISHCIEDAISSLKKCQSCNGISENEICDICVDGSRDASCLCGVGSAKDILTIEDNGIFNGRYFVLNNLKEPNLRALKTVIDKNGIKEILFALTPSLSSDSVILYIEDELSSFKELNFTKIAQGVPTGVSIENIDMLSLSKAIRDRVKV